MNAAQNSNTVSFTEALKTWSRVALLSFGGPAGQIAVMHRILVSEKKWIGDERFLHALNFCMLLPGPEAQQLTVYIGWLLHGIKGGIAAGVLFILPGIVSITALSVIYALYGHVPVIDAAFWGIKTAVLAIVMEAVLRIGRRALKSRALTVIAGLSFTGIFFFAVPFPVIIILAALAGYIGGRAGLASFKKTGGNHKFDDAPVPDSETVLGDGIPAHARPDGARTLIIVTVCLALWAGPVATVFMWGGAGSVFAQIAVFFSKAAMVTFGGAYAVLAYMAQQAVGTYGWVSAPQMLDGLAMAETTPGPLIMVTQFVGFMAAFQHAHAVHPLAAAVLGGLLSTWVTFVPCFLWILAGAPYIEVLRGNKNLSSALAAVTAAVVGVVLNLSVWFCLHTLFSGSRKIAAYGLSFDLPVFSTIDIAAAALTLFAVLATFRWKIGMIKLLTVCTAAGIVFKLAMKFL